MMPGNELSNELCRNGGMPDGFDKSIPAPKAGKPKKAPKGFGKAPMKAPNTHDKLTKHS
jgi:hypothetical protein